MCLRGNFFSCVTNCIFSYDYELFCAFVKRSQTMRCPLGYFCCTECFSHATDSVIVVNLFLFFLVLLIKRYKASFHVSVLDKVELQNDEEKFQIS